MYNGKNAIAIALGTDSTLQSLIPKTRMFNNIAAFQNAPIFPYLTYEEISNIEALVADDEEIESEVTYIVHIFADSNTGIIASHVNRIFQALGYTRNYSQDLAETLETGKILRHKALSFTGTFPADETAYLVESTWDDTKVWV